MPGKQQQYAGPQSGYSLSTPYGVITLSQDGRKFTFELFSDIKQSVHNTALFNYVQRLLQDGVTRFNVDHVQIAGRDRTMNLYRGKARLDLVYERQGRLMECELKTRRELGLEVTARQLTELVKRCERLQLLVPRGSMDEATTILTMIGTKDKITVVPYDHVELNEDV